jgi:cytochrome c553
MRSARWAYLALAASALCVVDAQADGDAVVGKQKAYTCLGCHAIPNYNNVYPTYRVPRLGGQHPEYIVAALKEYQSGERAHGTMHAQASTLSDQDMADIAAYLSAAPGPGHK